MGFLVQLQIVRCKKPSQLAGNMPAMFERNERETGHWNHIKRGTTTQRQRSRK